MAEKEGVFDPSEYAKGWEEWKNSPEADAAWEAVKVRIPRPWRESSVLHPLMAEAFKAAEAYGRERYPNANVRIRCRADVAEPQEMHVEASLWDTTQIDGIVQDVKAFLLRWLTARGVLVGEWEKI